MTEKEMNDLIAEQNKTIESLTAERDSFKTENEKLTASEKELREELKKTKELNFTLSRHVSREPVDSEKVFADFIK